MNKKKKENRRLFSFFVLYIDKKLTIENFQVILLIHKESHPVSGAARQGKNFSPIGEGLQSGPADHGHPQRGCIAGSFGNQTRSGQVVHQDFVDIVMQVTGSDLVGVHDAESYKVVQGNADAAVVISHRDMGDLLQVFGGCETTDAGDFCVDVLQHILVVHVCPLDLEIRRGIGDFHHGFFRASSVGIVLGLTRSTDLFSRCHRVIPPVNIFGNINYTTVYRKSQKNLKGI